MSSWRECKLGEITDYIARGISPKYSEIDGTVVINQKCIRDGKINYEFIKINDFSKKISDEKLLKQYDTLVNSTGVGTLGRVGLYDLEKDKCTADSHVMIVRASCDIDKKWLFYNLFSRQDEIELLGEGSTGQIELSRLRLADLEISLPPLEEQKAIAEVLSSLDDKIDLLHRQNQTLEDLAQTLFKQWFIEEAKEDWEAGTFSEVIEIFDNKRIPLSKMERDKMKYGELYPYYGAAQIMDYVNDFIFDGEYILMGEDGTVRTDEGYPILQYATGKFWVNNHTHVLQAKEPYSNFFIWNYLVQKNIDKIVTGAVQPKINQGNLKSLDFPKYPLDLIQNFNEQSQAFFEKINQNKKQIQTLENMRDTLLPKLLNGEMRVR